VQKLAIVALNSLLAAGLYATMSYGLAVIYGVMRIINLAHAGLMMLAAYATWALNDRFGLDPFLSMLVVAPAFFLLGMALYATVIRWLPRSSAGPSMQSTLSLCLEPKTRRIPSGRPTAARLRFLPRAS